MHLRKEGDNEGTDDIAIHSNGKLVYGSRMIIGRSNIEIVERLLVVG